ncbi:MAG: class II glutamine amidotransferase [Caldisericaceae bacterium]
MCRILFLRGTKEDNTIANSLLTALVSSSKFDPTYGDTPISHSDGYGYVFFGRSKNTVSSYHFRTTQPIFESSEINFIKELVSSFDTYILSIHARKALLGAINVINNHPYHFTLKNGFDYYLMHNGTLNKAEVEKIFANKAEDNLSDTYTLGLGIASNLQEMSNVKYFLSKGKELVLPTSALNTVNIFYKTSVDFSIFLTTFYRGKENYFKTFTYEDNSFFAFFSSTLVNYLSKDLLDHILQQANSTLIRINDNLYEFSIDKSIF